MRCEEMGYRVASASTMLAAKWGSNITEWGLGQFRKHYGDNGTSAEDISAYTYAMLHDPAYLQQY